MHTLLSHGLTPRQIQRLVAVFPHVEGVAASLSHHEDGRCATLGPRPCPWDDSSGALAEELPEVTRAVNAWCAVGWMERGLLEAPRLPAHDRDIATRSSRPGHGPGKGEHRHA